MYKKEVQVTQWSNLETNEGQQMVQLSDHKYSHHLLRKANHIKHDSLFYTVDTENMYFVLSLSSNT